MKKFLIIGNGNAVTYKEVFPLIKDNQLWIGNKSFSGGMDFLSGPSYNSALCKHPKYNSKGEVVINVMMCLWYTNLEYNKRYEPLELYKKYTPEEYPHYDNYDAIEVSRVADIPYDYDGVMGVPITVLDKYCPEQFEIVGIDRYVEDNPHYGHGFTLDGKRVYSRILIRRKH